MALLVWVFERKSDNGAEGRTAIGRCRVVTVPSAELGSMVAVPPNRATRLLMLLGINKSRRLSYSGAMSFLVSCRVPSTSDCQRQANERRLEPRGVHPGRFP